MLNMSLAAFRAATFCQCRNGQTYETLESLLKKDFYELTSEELSMIEDLRKVFNFRGKNYLGRSKTRQWFYHLQKGYKELPF